jgi:hypothetical protein
LGTNPLDSQRVLSLIPLIEDKSIGLFMSFVLKTQHRAKKKKRCLNTILIPRKNIPQKRKSYPNNGFIPTE